MSNEKALCGEIKLTAPQRATLDFVWEFITATGLPPYPDDFREAGISNAWIKVEALRRLRLLKCERRLIQWDSGSHGITSAITYIRHPLKGEAFTDDEIETTNPERKERRCLCCKAIFLSAHKFNRLCIECSAAASEYAHIGSDGDGYISNGFGIMSGSIGGVFMRRV